MAAIERLTLEAARCQRPHKCGYIRSLGCTSLVLSNGISLTQAHEPVSAPHGFIMNLYLSAAAMQQKLYIQQAVIILTVAIYFSFVPRNRTAGWMQLDHDNRK